MVDTEKNSYWREPMIAFGRMSGWVVGPILLALVAGKWLDEKYNKSPLFFLGLTALAFIISISGLIKETKKYLTTINKKNGTDTNSDNRDR